MTASWAKPTLIVRDEHVLTAAEAGTVRPGDYVYVLAPPEKAQALDRFFVNMPPLAVPDPLLLPSYTSSPRRFCSKMRPIGILPRGVDTSA